MTDSTPQVATFAFGKFGANVAVSKARLEVAMTQSTGEPETCAEDIETEPLLESGEECLVRDVKVRAVELSMREGVEEMAAAVGGTSI